VFLLVKVGVVGLIVYLAILLYLYLFARGFASDTSNLTVRAAGRLLQFCIVTLLATTYFIGGVFNRSDMFPILLLTGVLFGFLGNSKRMSSSSNNYPKKRA
jgi:hypothetical protein